MDQLQEHAIEQHLLLPQGHAPPARTNASSALIKVLRVMLIFPADAQAGSNLAHCVCHRHNTHRLHHLLARLQAAGERPVAVQEEGRQRPPPDQAPLFPLLAQVMMQFSDIILQ